MNSCFHSICDCEEGVCSFIFQLLTCVTRRWASTVGCPIFETSSPNQCGLRIEVIVYGQKAHDFFQIFRNFFWPATGVRKSQHFRPSSLKICIFEKKWFLDLGFGLLVKALKRNKMTKFQHDRTIFTLNIVSRKLPRGRGFCIWGKNHGIHLKSHTSRKKNF